MSFSQPAAAIRLHVIGALAISPSRICFSWRAYGRYGDTTVTRALCSLSASRMRRSRSQWRGGGWWLKRWLLYSKHAYLDNLSKVLPEPHAAFLAGVTVGERSGFPAGLEEG